MGALENFKVAIISESAGNWPMYVGLDKKFFETEGLDVEIIFTRSSVKQMQEVKVGGIYDVGQQAIDHVIRAVEAGSDLVAFMGLTKPNYSLIVESNIQSFADLRGRKLGVDGVATGFALLLKRMMMDNGLIDGQDYELIQIGGTGERYQAVLDGIVSGALLDGPLDLLAEAKGLGRLGSNLDYIPEYQGTVSSIRRSYAEENSGKLHSYIRAYVQASDWLHDAANKDEAAEILTRHLHVDREIAAKTYDRYMQSVTYNPRGELNIKGIAEAMKVMADTGQIDISIKDPMKYCDLSYYQQVIKQLG